MRFQRYGKSFQMVIENGRDLEEVLTLDEALWGALSAPKDIFDGDPGLFALLDQDKSGRITNTDIKTAIRWMLDNLPNHDAIKEEFDGKLPLDAIAPGTDTGKALRDSADYILKELKAEETNVITLAQIREFLSTVAKRSLNGDGVLSQKGANDPEVTQMKAIPTLVQDAVKATGGATDIDGTQGMDMAVYNTFLGAAKDYIAWLDKAVIPEGQETTEIMTMGANTPALAALVRNNAPKIAQFFQLCRLIEFDARLEDKSVSTAQKVAEFDPANSADVEAYQKSLPLATPRQSGILPFDMNKINPSYAADFSALLENVLRPILGEDATGMTQTEWSDVQARFAPYEGYLASKAGAIVEGIPVDELRLLVNDKEIQGELERLMVIDKGVADTVAAAKQVEKLLLYRTYLLRICNNFVCFSELYSPEKHAMFECGRVVIDGRWFGIALKVSSAAGHQTLGKFSQLFLVYLDVIRPDGSKMPIVIPVTRGTKGNLVVGKHGVFYDLAGKDYDVIITQIQENPICVMEALLSPILKIWSAIENKITSWSEASQKKFDDKVTTAVNAPAVPPAGAPAPAPAPAEGNKGGGMNSQAFLGISVACAAIGSAFAFVSKTVASMSWFQIIMMVVIALLAVLVPISVIACIKLSRQDLSSLLEGCGWGVNLRLRLNGKLRKQFTYWGKYPKDAQGTPRNYVLRWILCIILLIVLIVFGVRSCQEWKAKKAAAEQTQEQSVETTPAPAEAAPAEAAPAEAAPAEAAEPAPAG